jgi:uncharacterized membrane protein YdjX (TVP38/TMEM64 family)
MRSRRLVGLIAIAVPALVAAAILLPHSPVGLRDLLLSAGPVAPAIALGAWVVLVPALFPGAVLAAADGLAFGAVDGAALAFAGALGGGLAAFALARTVGRGPVERFVTGKPRLAGVQALFERRGFTALLAARLAPGVPASGLHYVAGASPVSVRAFAAAMAVGAVLRTVPYAVLGQSFASGSPVALIAAIASIVLGALAAAILVRRIRRTPLHPAWRRRGWG